MDHEKWAEVRDPTLAPPLAPGEASAEEPGARKIVLSASAAAQLNRAGVRRRRSRRPLVYLLLLIALAGAGYRYWGRQGRALWAPARAEMDAVRGGDDLPPGVRPAAPDIAPLPALSDRELEELFIRINGARKTHAPASSAVSGAAGAAGAGDTAAYADESDFAETPAPADGHGGLAPAAPPPRALWEAPTRKPAAFREHPAFKAGAARFNTALRLFQQFQSAPDDPAPLARAAGLIAEAEKAFAVGVKEYPAERELRRYLEQCYGMARYIRQAELSADKTALKDRPPAPRNAVERYRARQASAAAERGAAAGEGDPDVE